MKAGRRQAKSGTGDVGLPGKRFESVSDDKPEGQTGGDKSSGRTDGKRSLT